MNIQKLSSVSWEKLLSLLIFKNETNVKLNGTKIFKENVSVNKLIETKKVNGILLENILTKTGSQHLEGPILIKGDVGFDKLHIQRDLNQVSLKDILDHLTISNNTYIVTGKPRCMLVV